MFEIDDINTFCSIIVIFFFFFSQNLDLVHCIENICSKLKTHRGLYNVFSITTAKVPIVKFRHRRSQLEGDISMYNLLVSVFSLILEMFYA